MAVCKTKRELALTWWYSLSFEGKFYKTIDWLHSKGQNVADRHPHTLTGSEIQEIYEMQ